MCEFLLLFCCFEWEFIYLFLDWMQIKKRKEKLRIKKHLKRHTIIIMMKWSDKNSVTFCTLLKNGDCGLTED